ncbi:MAG: hypothetical protein Q9160_005419 [Pyrenula sp. 1 TL-2023]
MRLLDARALIHEGVSRLVNDDEVGQPHYAILSHTWEKEEVLFEDIALGPSHKIDIPNREQRAALGYALGSRESPFTEFNSTSYDRFYDSTGICKSCWSKRQSLDKPQGPHVKRGWKKVWSACLQACRDGYDYIWIDTCCIDKSSSTELSEALNSMFKWYADSAVCYTHLEDCRLCSRRDEREGSRSSQLDNTKESSNTESSKALRMLYPKQVSGTDMHSETCRFCTQTDEGQTSESLRSKSIDGCIEAQLENCRWLTRGWTLQEFIAPPVRRFFDQDWIEIGCSKRIENILCRSSGIGTSAIQRLPLDDWLKPWSTNYSQIIDELQKIPAAIKMSWAAKRQTSRVEDHAYSLLGLFRVNMPLLYGEGQRAFLRLQEEIIKTSTEDSIFAWDFNNDIDEILYQSQVLAPSAELFSWWLPARDRGMRLYGLPSYLADLQVFASFGTSLGRSYNVDFEISQKALQITAPLVYCREEGRTSNKVRHKAKDSSKHGASLTEMLRERDIREGNAEKAESAGKGKEGQGSNPSKEPLRKYSNKKIFSSKGPFEKSALEERVSRQHASNVKSDMTTRKGHMLLNCRLGGAAAPEFPGSDISSVRIALRLSHTYHGNQYVNSCVVFERPGQNEISQELRRRLKLDVRHGLRLALYLEEPETTRGAQSFVIRRDGKMN